LATAFNPDHPFASLFRGFSTDADTVRMQSNPGETAVDDFVELKGRQYPIIRHLGGDATSPVLEVGDDIERFVAKVYGADEDVGLEGMSMVERRFQVERSALDVLRKQESSSIVEILDSGSGTIVSGGRPREVDIVLLAHIEGVPFLQWVGTLRSVDDSGRLISAILKIASTLALVHDAKHMHLDVKSPNILVDADGCPHLIDFGLSKDVSDDSGRAAEKTLLRIDPRMYPVDVLRPLVPELLSGAASITRRQLRDHVFPWLDYYQFGIVVGDALQIVRSVLSARDWDYLEGLSTQLTEEGSARTWTDERALTAFERLEQSSSQVEELQSHSSFVRQISLPGGAVQLAGTVEAVLGTSGFRRLRYVNQLALISDIYPGAEHKRATHLLHAYQVACRLVAELNTTSYFRQLFGPREQRQLLAFVLLHDINHFPFLHTMQEAQVEGLNNYTVTDYFCGNDFAAAVAGGRTTVYEVLASIGIDADTFKRVLFGKSGDLVEPVHKAIRSFVDSGVDVDKLSYLYLDALHTGVNFGLGIDYPHLYRSAVLVDHHTKGPHLAYDIRAQSAVEHVVQARLLNFREIYWHHTNRALMAMVLETVRELFTDRDLDVMEYLEATSFGTEAQAVKWLDARYRQTVGIESPLAHLIEDRSRIFKRLLTLRPEREKADQALFRDIQELVEAVGLVEAQRRIRQHLVQDVQGLLGLRPPVQQREVLIDIPWRRMDYGGDTLIVSDEGPQMLDEISPSIRALQENFDQLAKRVRIYVHPRLAEQAGIDEAWRRDHAGAVRSMLERAVNHASSDPSALGVS
jgi:HD superfamily phosphohydrolase